MPGSKFILAPLVAVLAAVLAGYINISSIARGLRIVGVLRTDACTIASDGLEAIRIPDTPYCEDLHHHLPSGLLFTACESAPDVRHSWFPPLAIFDDASKPASAPGTITIIDPQTMKAKHLAFDGFSGPFTTHGIDVLDDPARKLGEAVYVFAVNHRPNEEYYGKARNTQAPKADSVIEVFHHVIGANSIQHIRTVKHPLIETPNDILALSTTSFLVTNDHFYREGLMRSLEDVYSAATWSTTIYAEFSNDAKAKEDETHGVQASVALRGLHNNNGLGRGRTANEVILVSAAGGTVYFGELKTEHGQVSVHVKDVFEAESTLDNPSYFADPYANSTFDASGFVLAGLSKAVNLAHNARSADAADGVMVWHLQNRRQGGADSTKTAWEAKLLLHDNADNIRTSSAAVLVPLSPAKFNGERKAWLFVTGFMSKNVLAVQIGL